MTSSTAASARSGSSGPRPPASRSTRSAAPCARPPTARRPPAPRARGPPRGRRSHRRPRSAPVRSAAPCSASASSSKAVTPCQGPGGRSSPPWQDASDGADGTNELNVDAASVPAGVRRGARRHDVLRGHRAAAAHLPGRPGPVEDSGRSPQRLVRGGNPPRGTAGRVAGRARGRKAHHAPGARPDVGIQPGLQPGGQHLRARRRALRAGRRRRLLVGGRPVLAAV